MAIYVRTTTGKAWAAALGALVTFLTILAGTLSDGHLDGGEAVTDGIALVTLASTIYAVWKTRNVPLTPPPTK